VSGALTAAAPGAPRSAGVWQGIAFIAVAGMPVLALSGLVADLPLLFRQFAAEPHHELLVPMIITVPSLCVAVFSGGAGYIADRWGRRPLLLLSLLAFSILGLMPLLFSSLKAVIASRVVVGVAEAAILTTGNALLGDYFGELERRRWLGYQNVFGGLFGSAMILAGGFLADWHWRAPFLLYLIGFPVFALAWRNCWEPAPTTNTQSGAVKAAGFPWRTAAFVCVVTLALSLIYYVQAVQHGRIFGDMGVRSPGRISVLITVASMGTVLGGFLFKRYAAVPVQRMLMFSLLAYGIAYLGVSRAPNLAIGWPLDALGQIGGGILLPTLIAWSLGKYDFQHRGRGMGLWGGAFFLGAFVSPPVMTLIGYFTPSFLASVGMTGVLCLLTAVAMWLLQARMRLAEVS
jgi:MFS family permease